MDYFSRKSLTKYLMEMIDFNKHNIDIFINDMCQKYVSNIGWLFKHYKSTWTSLLTRKLIENGGVTEQKILMRFLSHNIPKWNKLAEKISQKNTEYMLLLIAM